MLKRKITTMISNRKKIGFFFQGAKDKFQSLQKVFSILGQPEKRAQYDKTGDSEDYVSALIYKPQMFINEYCPPPIILPTMWESNPQICLVYIIRFICCITFYTIIETHYLDDILLVVMHV